MSLRFRLQKPIRLGPTWLCIKLHLTAHGYTGWSLHVWRYTYSNRMHRHTFDTPGPGSFVYRRKRGVS